MLSRARVKVECSRIRHIAASVIGYDRNVIADLVLYRPPLERIKGIADRHVRREGPPAIRAPGVEQLRIKVICSVSRVEPDDINAPIGRYPECAEPMPLVWVDGIVIDPLGRAEACAAIRAAREHYVGAIATVR